MPMPGWIDRLIGRTGKRLPARRSSAKKSRRRRDESDYVRLGLTRLEDRLVLDGAAVVTDLNPGGASSTPAEQIEFNGSVYFSAEGTDADGEAVGRELYRLDADGSVTLVADINDGAANSDPAEFAVFNGNLVFAATGSSGRELYRLDPSGDVSLLANIGPGISSSHPDDLYSFSDKLYFSATGSAGRELYVVNRGGNASLIADINPGAADSNPTDFVEFEGNLYFVATGPNGRILYRESPSGTSDPEPISLGAGVTDPLGFTEFNGALYFSALDPIDGRELFALTGGDQNMETVTRVANLDGAATSSSPDGFYVFDDHLYFAATAQNGRELFQLDAAGNIVQIDVAPGAASSSPVGFTEFDGQLYFAATAAGERGLYRLDTSGAMPVAASVALPPGVSLPQDARFYALGDELYFAADGPQGRELYRLDLTGLVTLAADINPGPGSSDPIDVRLFAGEIYFVASDPSVGRELFVLLRDPSSLRIVGNTLTFTDENGEKDNRLLVDNDGVNLTIRDENGHDIALLTSIVGASGSGTSEVTIPLASLVGITVLAIDTRGGNDSVSFDLSTNAAAFFSQFAAATYDGGSNSLEGRGDRLRFIGDGVTDSSYTPDAATIGSGVVIVSSGTGATTFSFENLEPVEFTGMAEAKLITPLTADGADLLTVSEGADSLDGQFEGLVVSGTVGGTPIESGYFFGNTTVRIVTGGDGDGSDQVTLLGADNNHNNTNLVIDTGSEGQDTVLINGSVKLGGELLIRTYLLDVRATLALGGDALLSARDDIQFSSSGQLLAQPGASIDVTLIADSDAVDGGGITLADGALINTEAGTITLTATGDILLGRLVTTNGTAAAILVRSTAGRILDGGDAGGADITTEAPGAVTTLQAAAGLGTAANPLDLAVRNLVTSTTHSDQFLAELDDLASLDLNAGTGNIHLTAGGAVQDTDAALDIRATGLTLQAATAGTWLNPLQTQLTTLTATAASGDLYFQELDGLTVTSATASAAAGDVGIVSLSGDLQVTQIIASNLVTLWAQNGAIRPSGGAAVQITARDLELSAANGIGTAATPLAVQVQRLEVFGGTGGIHLTTPTSVQVGGIDPSLLNLTGLSATASAIVVTASGSLTTVEAVQSTSSGAIDLSSAVNLTIGSAVGTGSGSIDLNAGRALKLLPGANVTTVSGSISLLANLDAVPTPGSFSGITLEGATIASQSGAITLTARSGDGGANLAGVELRGNSSITTADGPIAITGVSRGTGTGSDGVRLLDGSLISSSGLGEVSVNGTAGVSGHGVLLQNGSRIGATGTGDVLLAGTGGGGLADLAWDSLTIQKTGGVYTFQDTVEGGQVFVLPGNYQVVFLDGGTIVGPVEFQNSGGVVLGNEDSDTLTIAGGLTSTAGPTTIQGTLITLGTNLTLGATQLASMVTLLTAGGNVTMGPVAGAGVPLTINAGSGDVSLANPANVLGDLIITADQLTLVEADDITQAAPWTTTGLTNLNAGTNDIVLAQPANVLGDLIITADQLTLVEADDITQAAPWTTTGLTNLNAGTNDIVLAQPANVLGDLIITADQLTLVEADNITQAAAWTTTGLTTLNAGTNDIVLAQPANVLGDLIITADQLTLVEADDITQAAAWTTTGLTILNAGPHDILLAQSGNVLGNLIITADQLTLVEADNITQAAAWTTTGLTILNAGPHDILLAQSGNILGDLIFTANQLTLVEADDITQRAAWTTTGVTILNAGTHDILLAQPGNVLGDLVITANQLTLVEADDITQRAAWTTTGVTILNAGTHDILLAQPGNVLGDLVITANQLTLVEADDITQRAAWTTTGVTILNAGTYDILLAQPGNVLGALRLTGANITVVEADDMELGVSAFSGSLNVATTGNLLVTGAIIGNGTAQIAADGNIAFTVAGSLLARTATIIQATILADADGTGGGGIALADGAVIDAGAGTIKLTATSDITLGRLVTTNSGPAAVTITSLAGTVQDGDTAVDIVAGSLVLTALAAGTIDDPLQTQIGTLTAKLTASDLYLEEVDGLTILQVEALAPGGDVGITGLSGNILVQRLAANGLVSLEAVQGAVLKSGTEPATITATNLEIATAWGVGTSAAPLLTAVARFEAAGGSGGVFVRDSGDLQIGGIGPSSRLGLTGLSATANGAMDVRASRDLSLSETVSSAAGDITMAAGRSIFSSATGDVNTAAGTIRLLADRDNAGGGTIQFAGDLSLGSGQAIFSLPDANGLLSGTIQGTGGIVKQGVGTLTLAATSQNTYTGTTDVLAGALRVDGAIGAGGPAQRVTIAGGATLTGSGDVNAPIFASATTARIVSAGNLRLGDGSPAAIQFAGTLSVRGGDVVVLRDGNLAELGVQTRIESGGRLVAANGVEVGNGETLSGSGAVAGNVLVLGGGRASPGASPGSLATDAGDVELQPNAVYVAEINGLLPGSHYDQVNVQGAVSVEGAVLDLEGGRFQPAEGTVFTLVANDGADSVAGVFRDRNGNRLAEGATVRFGGIKAEISYVGGPGGNDITLTVVDSVFIRNPTDSPLAGAATLVVNDERLLPQRTTSNASWVVEATQSARNSEALDSRPVALEVRTAERLRVFFRVVNEGTSQEEQKEFELDPSVLRDVLEVFKRFRFEDGRYRIYIQEPGKRERLILDVNVVEGRIVPPNFREAEVQGNAPAPQNPGEEGTTKEQSELPVGADEAATPVGEKQSSPITPEAAPPGESGSWVNPSSLTLGIATAVATPACRARLHALLGDKATPRNKFARLLRRIRPR